MPILCKANSAIVFDRRLWHCATVNYSAETRHATFVGYAYRWLMPKEPMFVEPALVASSCPIRGQMLGAHRSNAELFSPTADLPLTKWLSSLGVDTAATGYDLVKDAQPLPSSRMLGDIGHATFPRNEQSVERMAPGGPVEATPLPEVSMDEIPFSADEFAAHRLTAAQRAQLEETGYLLVEESGLGQGDAARLRSLLAADPVGGQQPLFTQAEPGLQEEGVVQRLLTAVRVLPKVADKLGWNVQIYTAFAAPPSCTEPTLWGRSDGQLSREIATEGLALPCLGLLAVHSLADESDPYTVAPRVWLLPGSHLLGLAEEAQAIRDAHGGLCVEVPAGSVLLLDRRIIHARQPQGSRGTSLAVGGAAPVLALGYGYRWLRTPDPFYVEPSMAKVTCPITRQLLSYCTANYARYAPADSEPICAADCCALPCAGMRPLETTRHCDAGCTSTA